MKYVDRDASINLWYSKLRSTFLQYQNSYVDKGLISRVPCMLAARSDLLISCSTHIGDEPDAVSQIYEKQPFIHCSYMYSSNLYERSGCMAGESSSIRGVISRREPTLMDI